MNNKSENFYDVIAPVYPVIDYFLKPHKVALADMINRLPCGNLLEIGIGNGSILSYYRNHTITAIDTSREMLKRASAHNSCQAEILWMDGTDLNFLENSFDYVVLSHVIAVIPSSFKLLEEVYRVLKPNGKVIILNHFTPSNVLRFLDHGFNCVSLLLHFKSCIYAESLNNSDFRVVYTRNLPPFSYFRIVILERQ